MDHDANPASAERTARFEELHARVGARLHLLFGRAEGVAPLASTLIGYVTHEFLIVKTPTQGALTARVHNNEWLKARLFTGVQLAEFETTVLRQFVAPSSYWHLAYPAAVRVSRVRAAQRAAVELAASVECTDGSAPLEARLVDLNDLGAKVVAPRLIGERDASVRLSFALPALGGGVPAQISVSAKIKAVKATSVAQGNAPATPAHAHGVQFEGLGEQDRLLVQNFVLIQLNERPESAV